MTDHLTLVYRAKDLSTHLASRTPVVPQIAYLLHRRLLQRSTGLEREAAPVLE